MKVSSSPIKIQREWPYLKKKDLKKFHDDQNYYYNSKLNGIIDNLKKMCIVLFLVFFVIYISLEYNRNETVFCTQKNNDIPGICIKCPENGTCPNLKLVKLKILKLINFIFYILYLYK